MKTSFLLFVLILISCTRTQKLEIQDEGQFHESLKDKSVWYPMNANEIGDFQESVDVLPAASILVDDRKLIKNGTVVFKVEDIAATKKRLDQLIKENNGYPSNETQQNLSSELQIKLTVRIPANKFEDFISNALKLAEKVDRKDVSTQDVTEEFIDVQARLKTKRELESRYLEILKQAKTVEEILAIESNLSTVRIEIESAQGKLNYLNSQITMSSISITYYQAVGTNFGFASKLVSSFKEGWENLLVFVIGALSLWPFIVFLILFVYWFWRRKKKRTLINP